MRPPGSPIRSGLAVVASLLLLVACSTDGTGIKLPSSHGSTARSVVTFKVSGSDGGAGVDITYGSQDVNLQGGSKLPWSTTMRIRPDAAYYDVQAQLQGAGSITCLVRVKGVTKTTHAAGGYSFCRAEVINDVNGRWLPEN